MSTQEAKTPESVKTPPAKTAKPTPAWIANYNLVSGSLWSFVLINTILSALIFGQPEMFLLTSNWLTIIQALAIVEIYNSAVGNVRSPVMTTIMQVSSRLLLVFGIFKALPYSPGNFSWLYITLCTAWSVTEIIRYYYYAAKLLSNGNPPRLLTLLRYNTFTVLYPMGISSEVGIIYKSLDEAQFVFGPAYKWFLIACLAAYVPGAYILYTYMLKQRGKEMKKLAGKAKKAE